MKSVTKYVLVCLLPFLCLIDAQKCKGCAQRKNELSIDELKELRYEYLKNQILRKLHLNEPPKTNLPKPPLKSLLVIAEMTENETIPEAEDQVKTESVVIYPKEDNLTCIGKHNFSCNRFDFIIPESLSLDNFASAEIWLYKQNFSKSIQVYQIITNHSRKSSTRLELNNIAIEKQIEHWSKYGVPNYSFKKNSTDANVLVLQVIDKDPVSNSAPLMKLTGEEKPFLIIRIIVSETSTRARRSITCMETSTSCCKENFFLNFSEIGWDNWILHPDGYHANFCRGRCFNDLSNTRFYHSAVLLSYIRDNKDIAEEIGLNMCCTPSVMAPVTIIYRNEEGLIYHKSIENMKVEACNCA